MYAVKTSLYILYVRGEKMESEDRLGTEPIGKLLVTLMIPSIMAQMVNIVYNVVDRIFIGRMEGTGSLALAGLGAVLPIISIIMGFSNLVGMGGAPLAAMKLGGGEKHEAEKILGNCIYFYLFLALTLTAVLLIFRRPLLFLFGADESSFWYAEQYYTIYVDGNLFGMGTLALNVFITTQGFTKRSMLNTCAGAVVNIILDPILIFGAGLGIKGAAIATVISQFVSFIMVISFLAGKNTVIKLSLPKPDLFIIKRVSVLGFGSFFMGASESVVTSVYNRQLLNYGGSDYVAVMSILLIMSQFIYVPPVGMGQGAQPIISYNCGAHKLERVKKTFYLMVTSATVYSFFIVALMEIFAVQLFGVFTNDENLIQIGVPAMFLFLTGRAFNGIQFGMQHFFQAIGDALSSTLVATVRKIVLILPIALILPGLFGLGVNGVFLTESIADVCSAIFSIIMFNIRKKRNYGKCMDKEGVTE